MKTVDRLGGKDSARGEAGVFGEERKGILKMLLSLFLDYLSTTIEHTRQAMENEQIRQAPQGSTPTFQLTSKVVSDILDVTKISVCLPAKLMVEIENHKPELNFY